MKINSSSILTIFFVLIIFINPLSVKADSNSPYIYQYMEDLLNWRNTESLPPLPKLISLPSGIMVPEYTNKTDKYPDVFWGNNPMMGSIPFIVRVLTNNESVILLELALDALESHYLSNPGKYDMGFKDAKTEDFYILAIAETYRHSALFGPTIDGSIVFVFIMKENINESRLYNKGDLHEKYMPWPPGGINFLVLELLPNGFYKVNREGAAG